MLTFGELRRAVAPYAGRAGKSPDSPEAAEFAIQVMRDLLIGGSYAGVRKLCIQAHRGCIAMPPEVDTPLKVKIDRREATIWNKWFSFHAPDNGWGADTEYPIGVYPANNQTLIEDGTESPLAFPLPACGSIIGVIAKCEEDPEAGITIQGKDITGRPIYTTFNGHPVAGERFRLRKGELRHGQEVFGEITGVIKPITNGYIALVAYNPETGQQSFLADYSPADMRPQYRRFRIISNECSNSACANLSILCRVRLKDSYLDNELTLFENKSIIQLAAQRIQNENTNNIQVSSYKKQALTGMLDEEAGFKKISGNPVAVTHCISGGSVRNINRPRRFY